VKEGPVVLAAVEAVANADAVGASRGDDSDVPANATAREWVHAASPLASRIYGDKCSARSWLRSRLAAFGGEEPLEVGAGSLAAVRAAEGRVAGVVDHVGRPRGVGLVAHG